LTCRGRSLSLSGQAPPLLSITKNANGNVTFHGIIKIICDFLFDKRLNTT